jgi:rare lipoprotein A
MDHDRKSYSLRVVIAAISLAAASGASANPIAMSHAAFPSLLGRTAALATPPEHEVIIGIASFYDTPGELTASGEYYDGNAFTAAAQLEIRDRFGGIRYGRLYRPSYAIAEFNGKRAILKFNDVGPLRPGRKFDLSRAAMEHFGGLDLGLLPDFKIVLLPPGQEYTPGPLADIQLASMDFSDAQFSDVRVTLPAVEYVNLGTPRDIERERVEEAPVASSQDVPVAASKDVPVAPPTTPVASSRETFELSLEDAMARPAHVTQIDVSGTDTRDLASHGEPEIESVGSVDKPGKSPASSPAVHEDAIDDCIH